MQTQFIVSLLSLSLLGGCGGTPIKETPKSNAQSTTQTSTKPNMGLDRLVAYDFVNVLVQVDGFHPDSATLQMLKPDNGFSNTLKRVLREANYDVQTVENLSDVPFVDYSIVNHEDQRSTYALSVGQVFMEREYKTMDNGEVQPNSVLLIEGVDSSLITLSDSQPYKVHIPVKPSPKPIDSPVVLKPVPLANDMGPAKDPNKQTSFQRVSSESDEAIAGIEINPSFIVLVNGDENPPGYSEGESLVFSLQAKRDVRVSCYFQDPDANVMRMYPNSFVTSAQLAEGETVHIPSTDQWSVHATRAGSKDEVLCVSVEPELEWAMEQFDSSPDFEVMAYKSLDELLVNLSAVIGVNPEATRVSISVY